MTKYIIDTDPGTDDAVAFIDALNSPELDVLALTTVGGNASLDDTTRNALDLMAHLGRPDMPVYKGAETPLTGEFPFAYDFHGPGGLSIPLFRLPNPRHAPSLLPTTSRPPPATTPATLSSSPSDLSPTSPRPFSTNPICEIASRSWSSWAEPSKSPET